MTTTYQFPKFPRLEPRTPFQGGRIADTDVMNLTEAARFASVHAGAEITSGDFLRAAGRGEITMRAIVHQTAKLQKIEGGVYCNAGQPNENTVPNGSILNLPLSACEHLAATGRASWRKFDGFEQIDGQLMRYVVAELTPDEPDFETTPEDCRFTGNAVHALADAYTEAPAQNSATPAPLVAMEAQRGYVLTLPSGQTHIQFGELAHLIADALWPDAGADDTRMSYGLSRASLDGELVQAVKAGTLQVKDPLTFGPHTFPVGNALFSALVTVDDLREFVAARGLTVETAQPQATTTSPAPMDAVNELTGLPFCEALEQPAYQKTPDYQARYKKALLVQNEIREVEKDRTNSFDERERKSQRLAALNMELAEINFPGDSQQQNIEPQATTPSPAPVVADSASDAPATQGNIMKKAALIAALEHEWPSIEADISDATRNGLKAAAHTGKHGEWDKDKARAWAVSKGKVKQTTPVHSLAGAWSGATTRHTISR